MRQQTLNLKRERRETLANEWTEKFVKTACKEHKWHTGPKHGVHEGQEHCLYCGMTPIEYRLDKY